MTWKCRGNYRAPHSVWRCGTAQASLSNAYRNHRSTPVTGCDGRPSIFGSELPQSDRFGPPSAVYGAGSLPAQSRPVRPSFAIPACICRLLHSLGCGLTAPVPQPNTVHATYAGQRLTTAIELASYLVHGLTVLRALSKLCWAHENSVMEILLAGPSDKVGPLIPIHFWARGLLQHDAGRRLQETTKPFLV